MRIAAMDTNQLKDEIVELEGTISRLLAQIKAINEGTPYPSNPDRITRNQGAWLVNHDEEYSSAVERLYHAKATLQLRAERQAEFAAWVARLQS